MKTPLSVIAALTTSVTLVAQAAPAAGTLTAQQLINTLASARGVHLSPRDLVSVRTPSSAGPAVLGALAGKLRVDLALMVALVATGPGPVSPLLATRAVLESVSGKPLTGAQVNQILAKNPGMLVTSLASLSQMVSNINTLANINRAVELATQPVTPFGGTPGSLP